MIISQDIKLANVSAVGASETALPVSEQFGLKSIDESLFFRVKAKVSSVADNTGITLILQHRIDDGDTWATAGSVAITANGFVNIIFNNITSQTNLPLLPQLRLVVTTGATDAVTFNNVWITRET